MRLSGGSPTRPHPTRFRDCLDDPSRRVVGSATMTMDLAARHREMLLNEFPAIRSQAAAAIALFEEGATLPFIARYRKEKTGGLTEVQLKAIEDRLGKIAALMERKAAILDSVRE